MAKRIRFLQVVKSQLELANVELLEQDFESHAKVFRQRGSPSGSASWEVMPMLEPALNPGGRIVVFSSTRWKQPTRSRW